MSDDEVVHRDPDGDGKVSSTGDRTGDRDELAEARAKIALDELQRRLDALLARAQSLVGRASTLVGSAAIVGAIVGVGGAPAASAGVAWSFFGTSLVAALAAAASGVLVLIPQPESNVGLSDMRKKVESVSPNAGMDWVFGKKLEYYNRVLGQQVWRWWCSWIGFIFLLIALFTALLGAGARWLFQ